MYNRCVPLALTPVALSDSQKHQTDRRPLCARYYTAGYLITLNPPQNIEIHRTASRARTKPLTTKYTTPHTTLQAETEVQPARVACRPPPTIPPMFPGAQYMAMCEIFCGACSSTTYSLVAAHEHGELAYASGERPGPRGRGTSAETVTSNIAGRACVTSKTLREFGVCESPCGHDYTKSTLILFLSSVPPRCTAPECESQISALRFLEIP